MPLPLPDLDTRTWDDLVEEGRALIPRFAPAWTDHNVHDPGVTLLDLLAWLTEMDVYRLNRVPDAHRRAFLALAGVTPEPPRAATALLTLTPPTAAPGPIDIAAGAEFGAITPEGTTLRFRALQALYPAAVTLRAVLVETAPGGPPADGSRLLREGGALDALGGDPAPGAALWLGFDRGLPVSQPVTLALTFAGGRSGPDARRRIAEEEAAWRAACRRPLPPAPPCAAAAGGPAGDGGLLQHHSARIVWEFYTAGGWRALDPAALEVVDDTRALTLDGLVQVHLPAAMQPFDTGTGEALCYLRARLASGGYDTPPQIAQVAVNALLVEQAAPLTRAFRIAPGVAATGTPPALPGPARLALRLDEQGAITALGFGDEQAPAIDLLFYQPAAADQPGLLIADLVVLGRGDGAPGQVFRLPAGAVQGGSFRLYSLEPGAATGAVIPRAWEARPSLDASSARDAHVLLDDTAAKVTTGDDNRGRTAPAGVPMLAAYRATAAAAGNLAARTITRPAPTLRSWLLFDPAGFAAALAGMGVDALVAADPATAWQDRDPGGLQAFAGRLGGIENLRPPTGGADAESLGQAAARAMERLQAPSRAVTARDHELLALATPGTAIARVRALAGRHPAFPCLSAPGVVTVIVVPAQRRAQPVPSAGLLMAVRRYLDRRRIVGTHLEVVGPRYQTVQVTARVQSLAGADPARVRAAVLRALDGFLHPLSGGPAVLAAMVKRAPRRAGAPPPAPVASAPGIVPQLPAAPPAPAVPEPPPPEPGWPFGRDVYRSEVLQLIDGVESVDHVLSLELSGNGGPAECGNLCVGPTELVVSGGHTIEVV